jgi:hypothetical protein
MENIDFGRKEIKNAEFKQKDTKKTKGPFQLLLDVSRYIENMYAPRFAAARDGTSPFALLFRRDGPPARRNGATLDNRVPALLA